MKILITGCSGFIGHYLSRHLIKAGHTIIGIDKKNLPEFIPGITFKQINIIDYTILHDFVSEIEPELVIHLAARTDLGIGEDLSYFTDNTIGTENIVKTCATIKSIKKLIFTSTILVCQTNYTPKSDIDFLPTTPYGESKVFGEKIIRNSLKKDWTIIRPTSIWGPSYGSHYQNFFEAINKNRYVFISGYSPNITFGYLGNFAKQLCSVIDNDSKLTNNKVYYFGDYNPINLKEWARYIAIRLNKRKIVTINYNLMLIVSSFGDILQTIGYKTFPLTSYRLRNLTNDRIYNLDKTKEICEVIPYNMYEATDETIDWLKQKNLLT